MKLLPHARKVKFRLKFGDKEISSIAELKTNFRVDYILKSIESNQFSRWLEYLGETDLKNELSRFEDQKPAGADIIAIFFPELAEQDTIKRVGFWAENKLDPGAIPYIIQPNKLNSSEFNKLLDLSTVSYPWMEEYVAKHNDKDTLYAYAKFLQGIHSPKWSEWMERAADKGSLPAAELIADGRDRALSIVKSLYPTTSNNKGMQVRRFLESCVREKGLNTNPNKKADHELNSLLRNAASLLLLLWGDTYKTANIEEYTKKFSVNQSSEFYVENQLIYAILRRYLDGSYYSSKSLLGGIYKKHPFAKQLYEKWEYAYPIDKTSSWHLNSWPEIDEIERTIKRYEEDIKDRKSPFMQLTLGAKIAYVVAGLIYIHVSK